MVRFLQTSDWQIGMKAEKLGDAGSIVRGKRIETITNIFKIAKENNVDFLLICGDVFEHNMVSHEDVNKVISTFNHFPDVTIYLLPGNHDMLGAGSVYDRDIFGRVSNLTILRTCEPLKVKGATLHPLPLQSYERNEDQTKKLSCVKNIEGVHIGVAHGNLIGKFYSPDDKIEFPIDPSCLERTGIDYLALGHWHNFREFKDSNGTTRIAYTGTHEQTTYNEDAAGHCLLVDIDDKGEMPRITPIRCGELTWKSLDFEMKDAASLIELEKHLESSKDLNMLRLNLHGEIQLKLKDELDKMLEYQSTRHCDFRVVIEGLRYAVPMNLEDITDFGDPTLNQTDRHLRIIYENETNAEKKMVIIKALSMLFNIAQYRK